ncbi:hypothetical protein EV210_102350 [Anaerospora hongkongensis]|uniref:Uncharacterized protein n=1 Tax=Anaerospora hongkongensis TaxID=244830 RepID=A0A4V2Q900_9FIRM|nr:hypothetical protein EV210_102350 [Anaerospora hongkongensis]
MVGIHGGSLDGTRSFLWWRADAMNVAVIFNQRVGEVEYYPGMRGSEMNELYTPIRAIIDNAINECNSSQ